MTKLRISTIVMTAAVLLMPLASHAAVSAAAGNLGKILIDTSGHGEAWYVNPQTRMRVYLGRPDEALARLQSRANFVIMDNIARVSETSGSASDEKYVTAVSGFVLAPEDVLGASWYVDPATKTRKRLATPADAWEIMKHGEPASAATLRAIPVEPAESTARIATAKVKEVLSAGILSLTDGTKVRILSVTTPSNPDLQAAAVAKLKSVIGTGTVTLERDVDQKDTDGTLVRHVFAGEVNLGYELVRDGMAFHDISFPNYRYAEQLIVAQMDAARLKRGFWLNESTK